MQIFGQFYTQSNNNNTHALEDARHATAAGGNWQVASERLCRLRVRCTNFPFRVSKRIWICGSVAATATPATQRPLRQLLRQPATSNQQPSETPEPFASTLLMPALSPCNACLITVRLCFLVVGPLKLVLRIYKKKKVKVLIRKRIAYFCAFCVAANRVSVQRGMWHNDVSWKQSLVTVLILWLRAAMKVH